MRKFLVFGIAVVMLCGLMVSAAQAEKAMERIEKTGKIRMGFREGSIPFAFMDPKVGKHVGFSVDMTEYMVGFLSKRFGKEIEIVPVGVTTKTRIPMVANGTVDCEMGSTTNTVNREKVIDFGLIFFFSECTFLVPKDGGIKTIEDLNGKILGAARGSTSLQAVKAKEAEGLFKSKSIQLVETHPQGMLSLASGKVDAYCTDRSLLEGVRMKDKNPDKWMTVNFAINYEPYGYMFAENDSDLRDFVNAAVMWSIKTGKFYELYEKWMGPKGLVPIKISPAYKQYLEMIVIPIKEDWWKK